MKVPLSPNSKEWKMELGPLISQVKLFQKKMEKVRSSSLDSICIFSRTFVSFHSLDHVGRGRK